MTRPNPRPAPSGFTLVELMIVVAIIAMLAALAVPRLIGALGSSKIKTTQVQLETLAVALDTLHLDIGRYPTQQEGLELLVVNTTPPNPRWKGPYLKKLEVPKDAWGNPLVYGFPPKLGGVDYDLYSLGADGKPGGTEDAADIGNWGTLRKPAAPGAPQPLPGQPGSPPPPPGPTSVAPGQAAPDAGAPGAPPAPGSAPAQPAPPSADPQAPPPPAR